MSCDLTDDVEIVDGEEKEDPKPKRDEPQEERLESPAKARRQGQHEHTNSDLPPVHEGHVRELPKADAEAGREARRTRSDWTWPTA